MTIAPEEKEVLTEAGAEIQDDLKCLKLPVIVVAMPVKFHLSPRGVNQFTAAVVLKKIKMNLQGDHPVEIGTEEIKKNGVLAGEIPTEQPCIKQPVINAAANVKSPSGRLQENRFIVIIVLDILAVIKKRIQNC